MVESVVGIVTLHKICEDITHDILVSAIVAKSPADFIAVVYSALSCLFVAAGINVPLAKRFELLKAIFTGDIALNLKVLNPHA